MPSMNAIEVNTCPAVAVARHAVLTASGRPGNTLFSFMCTSTVLYLQHGDDDYRFMLMFNKAIVVSPPSTDAKEHFKAQMF